MIRSASFAASATVMTLRPASSSSLPGLGTFTQTNAHVATRILQIQRMSMTLRAIADNGDLLTLDELGICVLLRDRWLQPCSFPSSND